LLRQSAGKRMTHLNGHGVDVYHDDINGITMKEWRTWTISVAHRKQLLSVSISGGPRERRARRAAGALGGEREPLDSYDVAAIGI